MLQKLSLFLSFFAFSIWGASLVEYSGKTSKVADAGGGMMDSGRTVTVYEEASLPGEKGKVSLKLTGAGLRKKTIAIMDVNVYAAAHYLDSGLKINASNPLETIEAANNKVLQLTFFRSLTAKEIGNALKVALEKNGIDLNLPHLKSFFGQFEFSVSPGETMTLIGKKLANGEEELILEAPGKVIQGKGPLLATEVWKGYFGVAADAGLESLKKKLVGN